ncbi:glycosyltransferase family 4 protein [Henriciella aquimarina]|uniref:glycosyltransferase family 4 protein n=1 Tax=Henriciella aquimarina TaxID=545261 RepID=UPI0009FF1910|nr:glycosyltransferase family 1 protein [Henriciella aquimarina]
MIVVNGKFLSGGETGVHRVAHHILSELDAIRKERQAAEETVADAKILCSRMFHGERPLESFDYEVSKFLVWQLWEQIELPLSLKKDDLLLSLCNLAPVTRHRAITMIHDAQVFLSAESYNPLFAHWYQFAYRQMGKRQQHLLTVSDFSRQQLVSVGIAPAEKITVVPNGVDHLAQIEAETGVLERLGLAPQGYCLALANTQAHKNIGLLLEAFHDPRLADTRLVLFGTATAEDFAMAGHPPPPNTVFAGRVSDGALKTLMMQAGALLFPSLTEGFGLPPLEAMYLGCPTIVSPCGALPEICGDAALTIAPDDVSGWADAIISLLGDSTLRADHVARGHRQAAKYTWRKAAEIVDRVIAEHLPVSAGERYVPEPDQ